MIPPGPDGPDRAPDAAARASDRASTPIVETLKKRADFLACARGARAHVSGFVLQGLRRGGDKGGAGIRVGFTCSKKVGNAVARNRAKRRLRAVAQAVLPRLGQTGWDYVLIGRAKVTASRPFAALTGDLETALAKLHRTNS